MSDARQRQFDDVSEVNLGRNAGVSREQLEQLRQDIRSSLSDTLFTRLQNIEEVQSSSSTGILTLSVCIGKGPSRHSI